MGVVCFFSPIFSYFCLFVAALRPCQGKLPRRKYKKTWPRDSRSSRLDCSVSESERWITDQVRHDRTSAQVSVNTHVSRSSTQALAFTVRDVLLCLWITVLLGHPKIHDMYHCHCAQRRFTCAYKTKERRAPLAPFVPGRPTRKLSGLMSR